jgi:hypothetical protein
MFLVVAVGLVSDKIFIYSYHQTAQEAVTAANRSRECISLHDFEIIDCCEIPVRQWGTYADQAVRSRRLIAPANNQVSNSHYENNYRQIKSPEQGDCK